jgi:hypothetical protein
MPGRLGIFANNKHKNSQGTINDAVSFGQHKLLERSRCSSHVRKESLYSQNFGAQSMDSNMLSEGSIKSRR